MENKENKFEFTYKAPTKTEREQIEDIRNNYVPKVKEETKFEKLKKLDGKVQTIPMIWALCVGIFGTLIFGLGLTMILEWTLWIWGSIVGGVGAVVMAFAYPIYLHIKKRLTKKYGEEIIKLSDELLNREK